jgi:hypothetical protein
MRINVGALLFIINADLLCTNKILLYIIIESYSHRDLKVSVYALQYE